jgi:hypothetical protein
VSGVEGNPNFPSLPSAPYIRARQVAISVMPPIPSLGDQPGARRIRNRENGSLLVVLISHVKAPFFQPMVSDCSRFLIGLTSFSSAGLKSCLLDFGPIAREVRAPTRKSEIRSSKSETNRNTQIQKFKSETSSFLEFCAFWSFGFVSNFGIRISSLCSWRPLRRSLS